MYPCCSYTHQNSYDVGLKTPPIDVAGAVGAEVDGEREEEEDEEGNEKTPLIDSGPLFIHFIIIIIIITFILYL